jgi:hypothetical protein
MIALTSSGANLYRNSLEDEEIALGHFKSCPNDSLAFDPFPDWAVPVASITGTVLLP